MDNLTHPRPFLSAWYFPLSLVSISTMWDADNFGLFVFMIHGHQGRIKKIQEGAAGTLNSCILDTFYFSETEFYKNNTKFRKKRGGRGPLGPLLNPPMATKLLVYGAADRCYADQPPWISLTHADECRQACRAAIKDCHSCLFSMVPQVCCRVLSSPSTVLHQVFLGRPRLRFPSGVPCRAVGVMLPCSQRVTCPIHPHRLLRMMVSMLSWLQRVRSCWLEMVSGQKIRKILLRFFVWKVDKLFRSHSVILQHSEPYSRVESTQLWYSLSLVLVVYLDDHQTLFIILNAFLALLTRFLMSLPAPPSCLTMLPR